MMNPFSLLRAVAWLKRLALAAERIAESQAMLATLAADDAATHLRRRPRPAEFSLMDLDAIEKRLAQEQLERE